MKKTLIITICFLLIISPITQGLTLKGETALRSKVTLDNKDIVTLKEDNKFKIDIEPGTHTIEIKNSDYKVKTKEIKVDNNYNMGYILLDPKPGYIKGTVKDEDNEPLQGIKVLIKELDKIIKTNRKGQYFFSGLDNTYSSGPYTLVYKTENYKTKSKKVYVSHNRISYANINLDPKLSVIKGKTIANANIKNHKIKADQEGAFILKNIKPGSHTFKIEHKDYFTKKINIDVGLNENKELDFIDLKGKPGKITGKTVPNSDILFGSRKIKTNKEGIFNIKNIEPGQYLMQIKRQGYTNYNEKIEIGPNEKISKSDFNLERKKYIRNTLQEDSWIGNYFLNPSFKYNNYYPYLDIRSVNIEDDNLSSKIKTILADYILIHYLDVVKEINYDRVSSKADLQDKLNVMQLKGFDVKKEVALISKLKEEVNQIHKTIQNNKQYNYTFSHFILTAKTRNDNIDNSVYALDDLVSNYNEENIKLDLFDNEVQESIKNKKIIYKMISREKDVLKDYINTPLVSQKGEGKIINSNIDYMKLTKNDITNIVNFFNLFPNQNKEFENWLLWEEIFNEKD